MNTRATSRFSHSLTCSLVGAAALIGCISVSGTLEGRHKNGEKETQISATGTVRTFTHNNTTDKCFNLNFLDANGNVTGSTEIRPGPNSGTIPAGSTEWEATEKPCRESSGGFVGSGGGAADSLVDLHAGGQQTGISGISARRPIPTQGLTVWGGPIGFDLTSIYDNAMYEFEVLTTSSDEAAELVRQTLTLPIGSPVDSRVRIVSWFRAVQAFGVGKITGLARSPFTEFSMDVNGIPAYADLQAGTNVIHSQLPHGIWMIEANVNLFDINGFDSWNSITIRHRNGSETPYTLQCEMLHGSP